MSSTSFPSQVSIFIELNLFNSSFTWFVLCQGRKSQIEATNMLLTYSKKELSGSHNLARATRTALCKFFTKRRCPPRGWSGTKSKLETKLLRKFSAHVETWPNESPRMPVWISLVIDTWIMCPTKIVRNLQEQMLPPMSWKLCASPSRTDFRTSVCDFEMEHTQLAGGHSCLEFKCNKSSAAPHQLNQLLLSGWRRNGTPFHFWNNAGTGLFGATSLSLPWSTIHLRIPVSSGNTNLGINFHESFREKCQYAMIQHFKTTWHAGEAASHFELEDTEPVLCQASPFQCPEACIPLCVAFVCNPLHSNGDSCQWLSMTVMF